MQRNIFRIQAHDSVICGYFCIGFIDYMFGKTLIDYINMFSPHAFKQNDTIICCSLYTSKFKQSGSA